MGHYIHYTSEHATIIALKRGATEPNLAGHSLSRPVSPDLDTRPQKTATSAVAWHFINTGISIA